MYPQNIKRHRVITDDTKNRRIIVEDSVVSRGKERPTRKHILTYRTKREREGLLEIVTEGPQVV